MLSNAKDLSFGLTPYKDIFIQYGFLTTLIQSIAFSYFGHNLFALMIVTSVAYSIGLYLIYNISEMCGFTAARSLVLILICVLIHPIVIYPWSNYIAFPLLLLGLKSTLFNNSIKFGCSIGGIFFGLAVLSREGLAPAVLIYLLGSFCIETLHSRALSACIQTLFYRFIGFIIPISVFLMYLYYIDVLHYWANLTISLPRIYAEVMFPNMRSFSIYQPWLIVNILSPLFHQLYISISELEPRWMLFFTICIINILILIKGLFDKNFNNLYVKNLKIALLSLLLLSSSLHLPEIFRLATGSVVGLINLLLACRNYKFRLAIFSLISMLLVTCLPLTSGVNFTTTNYFFPNFHIRADANLVTEPIYFKGQRWPKNVSEFYKNINSDFHIIAQQCSRIKFHHNNTHDAFFQILSPFRQYQMAPFWFFPEMNSLRPDLDLQHKIVSGSDDLLLIKSSYVAGKEIEINIPTDFYIYKSYDYPIFSTSPQKIFLILPNHCFISDH